MNRPAKVVVAVLALAVVLWIGNRAEQAPRSASASSQTPISPPHSARLLAFSCDANYGRPRADLTFQNTGQTTIEYPKALVMFGSAAHDGYLDPKQFRPGSTATVTIYSPVKVESGCSFVSLQDRDGYSVSVSE